MIIMALLLLTTNDIFLNNRTCLSKIFPISQINVVLLTFNNIKLGNVILRLLLIPAFISVPFFLVHGGE